MIGGTKHARERARKYKSQANDKEFEYTVAQILQEPDDDDDNGSSIPFHTYDYEDGVVPQHALELAMRDDDAGQPTSLSDSLIFNDSEKLSAAVVALPPPTSHHHHPHHHHHLGSPGPVMLTQPLTRIGEQLLAPALRRDAGLPTALTVSRYIAIGTTHGFVLIFDHNQELRMILGSAAGTADYGPVTSLDAAPPGKTEGDWLACGHQGGQLVLWDVAAGKPLKTVSDAHTSPVVHTRFIADGRLVTADTKGVVNLTRFNRVFLMLVSETQLVLNGSVGPILSMAPLLPGNAPHPTDALNIVAFATSKRIHLIAALAGNNVRVLNSKISRPESVPEGSSGTGGLPYLSWRRSITPTEESKPLEPILAVAWGFSLQLLQVVNTSTISRILEPKDLDIIPVSEYSTDTPITGVEWMGAQALVLLNSKEELRVLDPFALSEVENTSARGMQLVYNTKLGEPAYHGSLRKSRGRIYLLGTQSIHTVHLLTWQERIETLVGAGLWLDALSLALDFHEGRGKAIVGLPSETIALRTVTANKVADLLLQFVSVSLGTPSANLTQLASVCIEYCLAIRRTDLLFGEILTNFQSTGNTGILLELLEPYIVHDKLTHLNPGVMKEMVEHYEKKNMLRRVEQCVLHLTLASLDIHQVVTLCRTHRLFGALIYVYTLGLDDYLTPLDDMCKTMLESYYVPESTTGNNIAQEVGHRLLVYVSQVLAGKGVGDRPIPESRLPFIKRELLAYLYTEVIPNPPPTTPPTSHETESTIATTSSAEAHLLLGTFPRLRCLLRINVYSTLSVLTAALTDTSTFAVADHQSMFRALTSVIIDPREDPFSPHTETSNSWPFTLQHQEFLIFLLAKYYARQMQGAPPDKRTLQYIIGFLVYPAPLAPGHQQPTAAERQTLLLGVLRVSNANDYDTSKVLVMVEGAEMYKAAQYLYSLKHDFSKVLIFHIKDPETRPHTFDFIRSLMADPELSEEDRSLVKSTTLAHLPQLIAADSPATSKLIVEVFTTEHDRILRELGTYPKLQYTYLRGLLDSLHSDSELLTKRGIRITPDLHELYVRLMCTYSPESIYHYLMTHDNYPLDACLRVCQQFNVTDATVYLLERTGDLAGALTLMLSSLNERVDHMLTSYQGAQETTNPANFATAPFPSTQQEKEVADGLSQAIALCQRNSQRLEDSENELLWFRLLDCPVGFLRKVKHEQKQKRIPVEPNWSKATTKPSPSSQVTSPQSTTSQSTTSQSTTSQSTTSQSTTSQSTTSQSQSTSQSTTSPTTNQSSPLVSQSAGIESVQNQREAILQKSLQSLTHLINTILMNMMGYVALPSILQKIVKDHAQHEFGDFKSTIVGMLDTYAYETTILKTANHLIDNDMYTATSSLVSNMRKPYSPSSRTCGLCTRPLQSTSPSSPQQTITNRSGLQGPPPNSIVIFHCDHAFHTECLGKHGVCPLCTKEDKKKAKHRAAGLPRTVLEDARMAN